MTKLTKSIQFKMTVGFFIMITLLIGTTFYLLVSQGKHAVTEQMREELMHTAAIAASQVNGDLLASLKPGDETKAEFTDTIMQMRTIRNANPQIKYIYTLRGNSAEDIRFIIDEDPENDPIIDELYEDAPVEDIVKGYSGMWATEEPYTDEWGTFLSGYAPIKNSNGEPVAIMGIDMDISTVVAKQNFLDSLIYWVMGIAVILSILLVLYYSTTITKPIIKLKDCADKVSSGNLDVELPVLKSADEVAELTGSIAVLIMGYKMKSQEQQKSKKK